jgi:hypothetical protein
MRNITAARDDLQKYLALAPNCPDRAEMERQLRTLKRYLVGLN